MDSPIFSFSSLGSHEGAQRRRAIPRHPSSLAVRAQLTLNLSFPMVLLPSTQDNFISQALCSHMKGHDPEGSWWLKIK